ncbi:transferrin-binding protein-like solute binding protein [Ruegeria sp. Ofav3-42]|uniref:transferrin-binding protein-like solute binding protein n=1 Tax=Ruegeria sp. Ofav3-42 TaxID=2917759 RepID=UPI001EF72918|nr:transferrin-binding protein-like solute binding protein [Ruegeria sp. Ofav3-42]MCG7518567.1 transferrin-binding protein-like solute binding protein [Ruegeria sp. Ofav3-42]
MTAKFSFVVIALFSGISLSACGSVSGGFDSGGSDGGAPNTGGAPIPAIVLPDNGTLELQGTAVTTAFTNNAGRITVGTVNAPAASTLQMTTESGEIVAATFRAPASVASFDTRGDDTRNGDVAVAFNSSGNGENGYLIDPSESRFEHQTFGFWIEGRGNTTGTAGAGSFGNRTPSQDVPVGRDASFQGASAGLAVLSDGTLHQTTSTVLVSTDFETATILSSGTEIRSLVNGAERSAPELNFSGSGNVSGNTFNANVSGTGNNGTADGVFYGPNATEVGGTFRTTGAGGATYIGAFGADR